MEPIIIPCINEQTEDGLRAKLGLATPHASIIQIDIADSTLVSAQTVTDTEVLSSLLAPYAADHAFEAHLMVAHPEDYLPALVNGGFSRVIFHVECVDPRNVLAEARTLHCEVGIAIDAETEIEALEPFLEEVDFVLVMTVDIGASGQSFQPEQLEKVKKIHRNFPDLPIEVDGGINAETAKVALQMGANILASSSFIFNYPEGVGRAMETLSGN